MAKVWFVRDGPKPTSGEPEYTLPLKQCIDQLGLDRNQWFSSLDRPPRSDDPVPTWPASCNRPGAGGLPMVRRHIREGSLFRENAATTVPASPISTSG